MARIIVISFSFVLAIGFAVLTVDRMLLDYNEQGVYFDGISTYDQDAVLAYTVISAIFFIVGIIAIFWTKLSTERKR
jgi:hypothetical protein